MENKETYGTPKQKEQFLKLLDDYKGQKHNLMSALQKAQAIYGYLPALIINDIASSLNVPVSEVYGVVTFYAQFSLEPRAKYNVNICMGTACFVQGSDGILTKVKEVLGLKEGQLSADGKWLIVTCRCLGCCGMAPVFTVNDKVYGKVKIDEIEEILSQYK